MNLSKESYETLSKMTKKEIEDTLENLDEELRTTELYKCEICNKRTYFWNRFMGFGACYHKKCIDKRIEAKRRRYGN